MHLQGSCHCEAVRFEVESATPVPYQRCYCSICRKTAGGGGYAINIMGKAKTLRVTGMRFVKIYHAIMSRTKEGKPKKISQGQRHFCKKCGSCLWIFDKSWPDWIYPFASAIDTPLPSAKERVHVSLDSAASWCDVPKTKHDKCFAEFSEESIEDWHKRHRLYNKY